jgi:hypothetical protein
VIERGFFEHVGETAQWCTFKSHGMQQASGTRKQDPRDKIAKTDQTPVRMPKV